MKKTRSIYCTESEYRRLKSLLDMIRIYDNAPSLFTGDDTDGRLLLQILRGDDEKID